MLVCVRSLLGVGGVAVVVCQVFSAAGLLVLR